MNKALVMSLIGGLAIGLTACASTQPTLWQYKKKIINMKSLGLVKPT
jgi:hypothetical protein